MVRRNRDAKFIIYQVLYIFVVTVLALKGAEINLGEVVEKENVIRKSVRDSLLNVVDSLSDLGLKFNIEVDTNVVQENIVLKEKVSDLNNMVASLSEKVAVKLQPENGIRDEKNTEIPFPFKADMTLLRYASNRLENKTIYPVMIVDPSDNSEIATIEPMAENIFEIKNQEEVIVKYGNKIETIKVSENLPPEIQISRVTSKMDKADIYVLDLQRTTCFNVEISDERLEQIEVNYSGPISVKGPKINNKGQAVYSVSLMLARNEEAFDSWTEKNDFSIDNDGRYRTNFFFSALDTKSKQKVEVGETFYFTEFSK